MISTDAQMRLIQDHERRYKDEIMDLKIQQELYARQRESARQAIIAFFGCVKDGELEAGIDILEEERRSW